MNSRKSTGFLLLSVVGFSGSLILYLISFFSKNIQIEWYSLFAVALLLFAVYIPIYASEYPESRSPAFFISGFAKGMPRWTVFLSWLLELIATINVVYLFINQGLGVPAIIDGQYAIDSHGMIIKTLSEMEYFQLIAQDIRAVVSLMTPGYFVSIVYWTARLKS